MSASARASMDQCSTELIKVLQLRPFEISNGKTLKNRLSKLTDEELIQQMKNDYPDDRFRTSKKGFNIEKDHRQIEQKVVQNRLRLYHLGQGTTYEDILKVLDALTKRDYPDLDIFDGSQKLQIFIPDQLLTASPQIIGEAQYQEIRNTLHEHDKKLLKKYEGYHDSLKGYIVEYECHEAIKSYFMENGESVLVIHSLNLEPLQTTGFKKLSKEKDFVIVNYTHCYIMVVEVKRTLRCNCDDSNAKSEACSEQKSAKQILGKFEFDYGYIQRMHSL